MEAPPPGASAALQSILAVGDDLSLKAVRSRLERALGRPIDRQWVRVATDRWLGRLRKLAARVASYPPGRRRTKSLAKVCSKLGLAADSPLLAQALAVSSGACEATGADRSGSAAPTPASGALMQLDFVGGLELGGTDGSASAGPTLTRGRGGYTEEQVQEDWERVLGCYPPPRARRAAPAAAASKAPRRRARPAALSKVERLVQLLLWRRGPCGASASRLCRLLPEAFPALLAAHGAATLRAEVRGALRRKDLFTQCARGVGSHGKARYVLATRAVGEEASPHSPHHHEAARTAGPLAFPELMGL